MSQAQADEQAELAIELHAKMFPQEPTESVEEEVVQEETNQPDEVTEEVVPHDDDIKELRKFKSRYLSLQGKYDSEVPRLHNELKEFKQSVFDRLESATVKQEVQIEPVVDKFAKFKEEYGEDLYEALSEIAAAKAEEKFNNSVKPLQEKVTSVEESQSKVAQGNFAAYLDGVVKGDWYNKCNGQNPDFVKFLEQEDPSGLYTYGQLVDTYNQNWDADRMAKVFNLYLNGSEATPQQIPAPQRQQRPDAHAMVAPSRQTVHTAPNASNKRIWTNNDINEFQRNDRKNMYSPEESKSLWDDLLSAMPEGRIR